MISTNVPPGYQITDRGTEYPNSEIANCYTRFNIRQSPRTSHDPGTNGLVEVQIKILGAHFRMFINNATET